MSEEALKQQLDTIMRGMRHGIIDHEAGANAIDRIHAQIRHEQMMKAIPAVQIPVGIRPPIQQTAEAQSSPSKTRPSAKLAMRMDWVETGMSHRYKINVVEDSGFIFILGVRNGEAFTIKTPDDNLFPTDEVITQLRMIYG